MTGNKDIWIQLGYEVFALSGPLGLKIEPLAKKVEISKSSFYHHFADIETFIHFLLEYHIKQSHIIADKERKAHRIDPELIHILVEHRVDLLFNRQLRINQNVKLLADTLIQSNTIVGDAFKTIWIKDLNLQLTANQLDGVFTLALENFFLQINSDNLNRDWLSEYFANLKKIATHFI